MTAHFDTASLRTHSVAMDTLGLEHLHRGLARFNHQRLAPSLDASAWVARLREELDWRAREAMVVERDIAMIRDRAATAPHDPEAFVRWFEALSASGPGQNDPLFPFLAEEASREQMTWFLTQEVAGEAGFDDLVALTQVKLPTTAKLELARNYWDEMGQGKRSGMHGPMLERLADELAIDRSAEVVWEALALGNVLVAFAHNRHFAYHSLGALGVVELTAPWRAEHVARGLERLGISGHARAYFTLHARLDVKHSETWNREVLPSIVAENPAAARAMAEGALVRLDAGRRCFERYRRELGVEVSR